MNPRADLAPLRAALANPRDVARRLGWRGVAQAGGGVSVLCPAHGDKASPSLSMTVGKDGTLRVCCFGACGLKGDVFKLVAAVHGLDSSRDFGEVVKRAAELADMDAPEVADYEPPPTIADPTFRAIAEALLRLCPMSGDVAAYLKRRGIEGEARRDGWGALPRWDGQGRVVDRLLATFDASQLIGSGMFYRRDADQRVYFAHAGARAIIPWRDGWGAVATIQRRRLDSHPEKPKYVFASGRPPMVPYGVEALELRPRAPIAYVEGAVDVLAFRVLARIKRRDVVPVALPGVSAWRASWAAFARGRVAWVALDDEPDVSAEERETMARTGKRPTRDVVEGVCLEVARDVVRAGARGVARVRAGGAKDWGAMLERRRG